MATTEAEYFSIRSKLLANGQSEILELEQKYMEFLKEVVQKAASDINTDFSQAMALRPFWVNYPPVQRGNKPRGTSTPWGEVGEKTISACVARELTLKDSSITFPGLPSGSDIRFATKKALIHLDIKSTGPTDFAGEVVASSHQISGDGLKWDNNGIINSAEVVKGPRKTMEFQPALPPFYVLDHQVLLCLTYFLKANYKVRDIGDQPLDYLELVCVPNGLLLFDGLNYEKTKGLLVPGKDERGKLKKRTRVRFKPLGNIADWRRAKIVLSDAGWQQPVSI